MNHLPREATSGGVREVLRIALPLVLSASGHAVRLFCDRMMLSWHSAEAIRAALPAGLASFTISAFFVGMAGYSTTFVSQYTGAGRHERVGVAVWQGMYLALLGGLAMATTSLFAEPVMRWFGHDEAVRVLEEDYFRILTSFGVFMMVEHVFGAFWAGRGRTYVVMTVQLIIAAVNVFFNWVYIFGNLGFPELGVRGAALATVTATLVGLVVYGVMFFSKHNREHFGVFPKKTFDADLFRRLVHFGLPNGVHFMLDLAAFNVFVVMMGRMGPVAQEAGTIAFTMNGIAFIPMIGIGMTASILVGQCIGSGDIPHAERSVRSATVITVAYMSVMVLLFVVAPDDIVALFERPDDPGSAEVAAMAVRCLRYIAVFLVFDGIFIIYNSALKGAGDTHFAMWMGVGLAWSVFAIPAYVVWKYGGTVWHLWMLLVGYVILAGTVFYLRYRWGPWRTMRVIETEPSESILLDVENPGVGGME